MPFRFRSDTRRDDATQRRLLALTNLTRDPLEAKDVLRVETEIGPVLVHADDKVMTPFIRDRKVWEPDESAWLLSCLSPGATLLDVGANIGYFSLLGAQAVGPTGQVIAVEPEQRNLQVLRTNVWPYDQVEILPVAAWHERTTLELRFNADNAGDHQVHPGAGGGTIVPAIPLDELLEGRRIDVIKIDTQGVDHRVITGLERTLKANPHAPMLVEFWLDSLDQRGEDGASVLAEYRRLGRSIALLGPDGSTELAADDAILAKANAAQDRWVNLVFGPAGSAKA